MGAVRSSHWKAHYHPLAPSLSRRGALCGLFSFSLYPPHYRAGFEESTNQVFFSGRSSFRSQFSLLGLRRRRMGGNAMKNTLSILLGLGLCWVAAATCL